MGGGARCKKAFSDSNSERQWNGHAVRAGHENKAVTMSDQSQQAQNGALAIQSGRDVIIQHGITPGQMKEILDAVAAQFPVHLAAAREIVDGRIADFERRVLERFDDKGNGDGRRAAFADPDFLYVLKQSQHAYLRSGDEGVRETLIDLIARRSKETARSRLSLTLNDAVEKSAVLTSNEFAELSFSYLLGMTMHNGLRNMDLFAQFVCDMILPLLPDISRESASYQYLVAQSCATISQFGQQAFIRIVRLNYGGLFARGFTMEEVEKCLPDGRKQLAKESALYVPCLNDPTKIQIAFLNKDEFDKHAAAHFWKEPEKAALWGLVDSTTMNGEDLIKHIEAKVPEIRQAIEVWDNTPLCRLNLTTVGIAIGHSNLVRLGKFKADLGIWIK